MLDRITLEKSIEDAIGNAMTNALLSLQNAIRNQNSDSFNENNIARIFGNEAKTCAHDIAGAIDTYIKSAQLMIPIGSSFVPAPTLVSPTGPCTGTVTFVSPLIIQSPLQ